MLTPAPAPDSMIVPLGAAFVLVHGLEWLKGLTSVKWISVDTDTLNQAIAVIWAFLTSCGVVFVASPGGWMNGGIIQLPPASQFLTVAFHALAQVAIQQAYYVGVIKKNVIAVDDVAQAVLKALDVHSKA